MSSLWLKTSYVFPERPVWKLTIIFVLLGLESEHKQSFLEDLDEVDALFNGSTDHESMFDFNPEKGIVFQSTSK